MTPVLPPHIPTKKYEFRLVNVTGTTQDWLDSDLVLKVGEIGWDRTLEIAKIGNGVDLWPNLPEFGNGELTEEDLAVVVSEATEDVLAALEPTVNLVVLFENALL